MSNLTLDLTPGVHTLIIGPPASGRTTALQALAADAESSGHRVLAIDDLATAAHIAHSITTGLEYLEGSREANLLVITVDDLDTLWGDGFDAVAEATRPGASARIHIVATAETDSDIEDFIDFGRVIVLDRA